MRKRLPLLVYIMIALFLILYGVANTKLDSPLKQSVSRPSPAPSPPSGSAVRITRVVDGDTVTIDSGQKVRYIGIDAPETVDPRRPVGCFGKEASEANKRLVEGKYVRMEKDVSETDKYGRLLRYVWVYDSPDATGSAIFVNEYLVREGYARASTYPPDVTYSDYFVRLQEQARQEAKGLWSKCNP